MVFAKNEAGIEKMFKAEQSARAIYSKKIRFNEDTSSNYFEDKEGDKTEK
jgi:hypothetical protein